MKQPVLAVAGNAKFTATLVMAHNVTLKSLFLGVLLFLCIFSIKKKENSS